MTSPITFRFRLALGFLEEAEQDAALGRWRACVAHAQLSVENALKAIIALFAPVPRTHTPTKILSTMLMKGDIPHQDQQDVQKIIGIAQTLDSNAIHAQTDYGDEFHGLTPWELFSEEDAQQALTIAQQVMEAATALIQKYNDDYET